MVACKRGYAVAQRSYLMPFTMKIERTSLSKLGRVKAAAARNSRESFLWRAAARNAGDQAIRRFFNPTVKTWNHRVVFKNSVSARIGSNLITYTIDTTDQIWHWIDAGTSARYRKPDPNVAYATKTVPGVYDSFPGGGRMIYTETPRPGVIPRRWTNNQVLTLTAELLFRNAITAQVRKLREELTNG